ncbi:CPBP family intramembrane glutamic endopeptidase [Blastococcus sp. TF02A_35]|uniref:CPBP family intramembrane glutamic endopeptidase n=1 Tax=Blastococcus sp. TF02A-35 TaxID=2559612 RepID=UPI0010730B10|nr:CPBP family intramembrane glutamic endopeptidase [Blastococcus sp. TF02A_35]TFV46821.1 CPBP family intramembrane metalloprotease [Blastococcus sp. TF02A_35]
MSLPGTGVGPEDAYAGPPPFARPGPDQPPPAPWPVAYAVPPWAPPWPSGGPPQVAWAPPPGTPPHDEPQPYLHAMRARGWAWWRPLVGLLLLAACFLVAGGFLGAVAVVTGTSADLAMGDLTDPLVLLVTNLALALGIPVVWLAWSVAHSMGPGWSSSVLGRLRWRLLPRLTLLALVSLGLAIGLALALDLATGEGEVEGPVAGWGWLLAVVLLTTPLQSAAEEYLFRGYLSQTVAGWVRSPAAGAVVAALVTGAVFSLAHLPPDLVTFLDRFAFALAASAVVWLTGGLEAAIVLHVVNNVVVFLAAGLLGGGVATESVPEGAGPWPLLIGLAGTAAYVALVARWRRGAHPETRTAAQDLRGPFLPPPVPAA